MTGAKKFAAIPESPSPASVRPLSDEGRGEVRGTQYLVEHARRLIRARARMEAYIPPGLIKDWAWDMLLELFVNNEEGSMVYVKQLILASGVSPPAAMRLIDRLEEAELIRRLADPLDSRRVIVTLSERGREAMLTLLRHMFDPPERINVDGARASFSLRR